MKKHMSVPLATPHAILGSHSILSETETEFLFESFKRQHHSLSQDPQNTKSLQHFNLRLQEKLIARSILLTDLHSKSLLQHCLAHIALIHRAPLPLETPHPLFKYTYDILNYLVSNSFISSKEKDIFLHGFVQEVSLIYARFIGETEPPRPLIAEPPIHNFGPRHTHSHSTSGRLRPHGSVPEHTFLSFLNPLLGKIFSHVLSSTTLISRQNRPILIVPRYESLRVNYSKINTDTFPKLIKKGFMVAGQTPSLTTLQRDSIAFWFTIRILAGLFSKVNPPDFQNRNSVRLDILTSTFLSDPFFYRASADRTLTVYTHVRAFHEENTSLPSKFYLQHSLHQSYAVPEAERLRIACLASWGPQQSYHVPPPTPPTSSQPDASHWPRSAVGPQPVPPFPRTSGQIHPAYQVHYPG